jgi:hypothetical protein
VADEPAARLQARDHELAAPRDLDHPARFTPRRKARASPTVRSTRRGRRDRAADELGTDQARDGLDFR